MLTGYYQLQVYCDGQHTQEERDEVDQASTFYAASLREAIQLAVKEGWEIRPTSGTAWCPDCAQLTTKQRRRRRDIFNQEHKDPCVTLKPEFRTSSR